MHKVEFLFRCDNILIFCAWDFLMLPFLWESLSCLTSMYLCSRFSLMSGTLQDCKWCNSNWRRRGVQYQVVTADYERFSRTALYQAVLCMMYQHQNKLTCYRITQIKSFQIIFFRLVWVVHTIPWLTFPLCHHLVKWQVLSRIESSLEIVKQNVQERIYLVHLLNFIFDKCSMWSVDE